MLVFENCDLVHGQMARFSSRMSSFALYVHIPYCARKCPYCDFNVHVVREIPEAAYAEALVRELDTAAKEDTWRGRGLVSIFFGGGTPSMFHPDTIDALVERMGVHWKLESDAELTLEANPEDLCRLGATGLRKLRATGVNRLSIGAQSFNGGVLATLGRAHVAEDIEAGISVARDAGFENISCDLMFAVPGQSLDAWTHDLQRLCSLGAEHISTYGLTYEAGTPFGQWRTRGRLRPVEEELERTMYERAIDMLGAAGYEHYEVSNFARPGFRSRHNQVYWGYGDYLGIGAGAHGFARYRSPRTPGPPDGAGRDDARRAEVPGDHTVGDEAQHTDAQEDRSGRNEAPARGAPSPGFGQHGDPRTNTPFGFRYVNVRDPVLYMQRAPVAREQTEQLVRATALCEAILLGMRLLEGLDLSRLKAEFCPLPGALEQCIERLSRGGLIECQNDRIRLTRQGLLLADSVTEQLVAAVG